MRNKNRKIILQNLPVTDYAAEGKALAKQDGKVIFISGAVPGDVADVLLVKNKKDWAEGRVIEIKEYSKERVSPFFRHFGRFYPALPMIVVDDSPNAHPIPGVETVILPPDSGLSVGRMEGLKRVKTPYILLLDDDFVFYRHTRLEQAVALMEQHPTIDIMGGAVVNLPFFTVGDYQKAGLYSTAAAPTYPPGTLIGNLPTLDQVANFFIARSDRLRLVEWDANLKLVEHADFFTRARGLLTTVYNQDFCCLHARTPFDKAYMHKRNDFLPYVVYLQKKYRGERNV